MSVANNYSGTSAFAGTKNGVDARTVSGGVYAPSPIDQTDLAVCFDPANENCYPGSGAVIYDLTSFNHDLIVGGGMESSYSQPGTFEADGVNDFSLSGTLPSVTGDFTMMAWVNFPSSTPSVVNGYFFSNFYKFNSEVQGLRFNGGSAAQAFEFVVIDASGTLNITRANLVTVSPNTWYLVCGSWNDTTGACKIRVYDSSGLLQSRSQNKTAGSNSTVMSNAYPWYGSLNSPYYINAKVGEAAMYKRRLTNSEQNAYYEATKNRY